MYPPEDLVKLGGGMFQKLHGNEMVADADGCLVIFLFHELGIMGHSAGKMSAGWRALWVQPWEAWGPASGCEHEASKSLSKRVVRTMCG